MRGKLNAIILSTLKSGNKYGLEIIKEIKHLTNGQMDVKLPSLYSNLHKLESDGFITSYWENSEIGGKRRYSALTEKGRKYIEEHPYNFDEFKKFENVSKNVSTTLAIQPDFFNTIEHTQRLKEETSQASPTRASEQDSIQNYSILDYMNNQNENKIEQDNQEQNRPNNDIFVYDKTDAVLLSDDEIIPQDASTSLLYKPTTLTHKDIIDDSIDYDTIFGDMIEKDSNYSDASSTSTYSQTDKGILLDPNLKGKYADDYLSMVSNKSTTAPISYSYESDLYENNLVNEEINQSFTSAHIGEPNIDAVNSSNQKNVASYLLKEKVNVDDNLKANIFLKRQKNKYDYSSDYDFYNKYDSKTVYEKLNSIINRTPSSNANDAIQDVEQEYVRPVTLLEFIEDCENSGIVVQKYRKNQSQLKSHRVYINKTNLLTAIMSYATLLGLMFICYFAFKESLTELQSISYLIIGILSVGLIYPVVYAFIAGKNHSKVLGYYNMQKELLPRSIIFAVIVLLTISINLLCGLNSSNIIDFLPFIVLPIVASLVIYIDYLYKSLLLQLKAFREE